mgnify:FL=1
MTEKDRMVQELPEEAREKILNGKLLSLLGFAMRAGKLSCGTDRVCDDIRRHGIPDDGDGKPKHPLGIVLIAADASANTKKRIINACTYYNMSYYVTGIPADEIGQRTGKSPAVCAVFDRDFTAGISKAVSAFDGMRTDRSERS